MQCLRVPSDGAAKGAVLMEGTSAGRVVAQAASQAITSAEAIVGVTGACTEVPLQVGVVMAVLTGAGFGVVALGVPGT